MITAKQAKTLFSYNKKTGLLRWQKSGKGRNANLIVGCADPNRYIVSKIGGRTYQVHRLI